jgi:hypothetical protein
MRGVKAPAGPPRVLFVGSYGARFTCDCGRTIRRGMLVGTDDGGLVCSLGCLPVKADA